MEQTPTQLQSDVVNAFLDQFEEDPGWSLGFVHADYSEAEGGFGPVCSAFLVRRPPDPDQPDYVPLGWPVVAALMALREGFARDGQDFRELELEIEAGEGRYRFSYIRDVATGDPKNGDRLLQRYREIIARS